MNPSFNKTQNGQINACKNDIHKLPQKKNASNISIFFFIFLVVPI